MHGGTLNLSAALREGDGLEPTLRPVTAASLGRLVAAQLLQALEAGTIPVGSRLVEARLAAMLGVSRGPIRDALQYLEQQGLVHRLPHKGSFAVAFAPEQLAEVVLLRADLEALAARLGIVRRLIRPRDIRALLDHTAAMARAVRARQFRAFLDHEMAFHRLLAERAGNSRLLALLDGLRAHTRIAISLANRNVRTRSGVPSAVHHVVETHRDVVAALESKDLRRIDVTIKRHVLETLDFLGLTTPTLTADRRALGDILPRDDVRASASVGTRSGRR
jgi:DNA-binding GntR family transcriptional regulator